jgi:hypothetical protein
LFIAAVAHLSSFFHKGFHLLVSLFVARLVGISGVFEEVSFFYRRLYLSGEPDSASGSHVLQALMAVGRGQYGLTEEGFHLLDFSLLDTR